MLETVLMRAFWMIFVSDFETHDSDEGRRQCRGKSKDAEYRAFRVLSWVCSSWYFTLIGWPQSPTGQWVKHRLRKLLEREYFVFSIITP